MPIQPSSVAPDATVAPIPDGCDIDARTRVELPAIRIRAGLSLRELEDVLDWLEQRPIRNKRIAADGPQHFQVVWEE